MKNTEMSYEEFTIEMEKEMAVQMPEVEKIEMVITEKNNGVVKRGLRIKERESNISPVIYLEKFYQVLYQTGMGFEDVTDAFKKEYESVEKGENIFCWKELEYFDKIQNRISYKLINFEKNKALLTEVPFMKFQDLAIVFHVLLGKDETEQVTMLVRNNNMEMWSVTTEQLYELAKKNTKDLLPVEFKTMKSVLQEMLNVFEDEEEVEEDDMYVLTNLQHQYGAIQMLDAEILVNVANTVNGNFYILPSSLHELIIVPEKAAPQKKDLEIMVEEINSTQVEPEEVLSNHVYYYNQSKRSIE